MMVDGGCMIALWLPVRIIVGLQSACYDCVAILGRMCCDLGYDYVILLWCGLAAS